MPWLIESLCPISPAHAMAPLLDLKVLLPLLTSLLFAGSFVAGKYTTVELGPLTTSLLRYVIALTVPMLARMGLILLGVNVVLSQPNH